LSEKSEDKTSEALDTLTLPSPLELMGIEFQRTAIIGVGLIGGSIGLRMKAVEQFGTVVGHDRKEVLDEALERGAIDRACGDLSEALAEADLIVLATPLLETAKLLPTVLKQASPKALVTDTAPVKTDLVKLVKGTDGKRAQFIGGHPLAGSNRQGISSADPSLFENGYWLFTPLPDTLPAQKESLSWWARTLGAYPLFLEAELHDQIVAATTHVPFMIALALSNWIAEASAAEPLFAKLATGHFQTITNLAGLPLAVWEEVIRTNEKHLIADLDAFCKILQSCGKALREGRLQEVWQRAHALQRRLGRERPGDWDANCEIVVTAEDRPGTIAQIAGLLATADISIRDIHVLYIRERRGGTLKVVLESRDETRRAMELLMSHGYVVRLKE
jgi:prephenate dehydrogenase